ncbi:alpha/beta hydrolase family protein [Paenibacillus luteus]|uniref:alpha/beta hydrolase family protein n=1 Tax=Paenibacillus luteus TaxID=2545753 RepID=UPI001F50084B|nr:alpha/beta fold hydrolase [Paenibacillus luteus]
MSQTSIVHQTFTLELNPGIYVRGDVRVKEEGGRWPVLLLAHGFKGFKDWGFFPYAAERLARQDFAVVTFNFSYNGVREQDFDELDKFGRNTYSQEQEDLTAVFQAVLEGSLPLAERLDNSQIVLVGHSRGGGNSVLFAAEHPEIRGVASWNGISNVNLFGAAFREQVLQDGIGYVTNARTKQEMPIEAVFFEDIDLNRQRFNIVFKASELQTPILFIQGGRDSERLLAGFHLLQAAAPHHRFALLEEATHTFGTKHPFSGTTDDLERAIALTSAFFAPLLKRNY